MPTLLFAVVVAAAGPALAIAPVFSADGVAIRGYDPVAYFSEGKPVAGSAQHSVEFKGTKWLFASAENRDLFVANPEKYAPQYGGYCAWAVANNYTASIDPDAWTIKDGKLYLNFSKFVRARWAIDKSGNIAKGDANWPGLRDGG
ncbi:MAG: YHS domain-containing protein [Alphaproteobacteria bacterium]|nr:YHS domain-containing protein [Alphaproteobacteria bacterium]